MTDEQKKKLAACVKAKGATLCVCRHLRSPLSVRRFGAQWCGYTRKQLELFGAAQSELAYVECSEKSPENEALCNEKGA